FISGPQYTKATKKNQFFFVNGRHINSKLLETAIKDGYREKIFEGRFPTVFLFLWVSPESLDVNIHPNKKEVRFDDEKDVMTFVTRAIFENLNKKEAIPEIKKENIFALKTDSLASAINAKPLEYNGPQEQVNIKHLQETSVSETKTTYEPVKTVNISAQLPVKTVKEGAIEIPLSTKKNQPFHIEEIALLGSIFGTYILGCDEDSFYLIDQHAAHERIFYEELLENYNKEEKLSQQILLPMIIQVSLSVKNDGLNWLGFLNTIGFEIEEFGDKSYRVTAIPMFMELTEGDDFLNDFLDNISENTDFKDQRQIEKIISHSCKSAVKAHDLLDIKEISKLMRDLALCKNPYSCPHGRPVFIKMTKYEIEKMFKRV
ncbi:MAG: DNA mismatch repair endonuclease MutL, partial [Anaerovorax sp.]